LPDEVRRDEAGFVRTEGLATSLPGVFAIGDVRAGSVKRVATAVGDGAAVIALIHGYLADLAERAG
jgi:thioredoxin reductase (NADPH)